MKKNILYLEDNVINYYSYKHDKIYIKKLPKDITMFGIIKNPIKFTKLFEIFLKENKIKSSIFLEKIIVITNIYFTNVDKMLITDILNKQSYKDIEFILDKKLINIEKNKVYINNLNTYTIIYYKNEFNKDEVKLIDHNLFSEEELINYIRKITKNKATYIFGINKNIDQNFTKENEYIFDIKYSYFSQQIKEKNGK